MLHRLLRVRHRAFHRKGLGLVEQVRDFLLQGSVILGTQRAIFLERSAGPCNRILLLPGSNLIVRSRVGTIEDRVVLPSVGLAFDKARPCPSACRLRIADYLKSKGLRAKEIFLAQRELRPHVCF